MNQSFFQLFLDQINDIYSAENQIIESLPNVIKVVTSKDLRESLQKHLAETRTQKERLDRIFTSLSTRPDGTFCEGMAGLLQECDQVVQRNAPSAVEDASLIACLQKIEHYEIAAYGTLRTFAHHLNLNQVEDLLQESLDEEGNANKKLTSIAEGSLFWSGINAEAAKK